MWYRIKIRGMNMVHSIAFYYMLVIIIFIVNFASSEEVFSTGKNSYEDRWIDTDTSEWNSLDYEDENETPVRYEGAQVWRVRTSHSQDENALDVLQSKHDGSLWARFNTESDILIKAPFIQNATSFLNSMKIPFSVFLNDTQKAIDNESPTKSTKRRRQAVASSQMSWNRYHSLQTIYEYLFSLETNNPDLCKVLNIGSSSNNRTLKVLRISDSTADANRTIWIDGGMHAREWISPASVTFIIQKFVANWATQPEHIRSTTWYIMPVANPDGYEYSRNFDRMWRKNRRRINKNCIGVDLNRNFDYKWGGEGASKNPCSETYRGPKALSEPESMAMAEFLLQIQPPPKAYLTFHSYGQYVLFPWGYSKILPRDYKRLQKVGLDAAKKVKSIGGLSYDVVSAGRAFGAAAGGSDDWARGHLRADLVYTVELRDRGRYGFLLPPNQIIPTSKEAYSITKTISNAVSQ